MILKLRWKMEPQVVGQRFMLDGKRGFMLHDGKKVFARICSHGAGWFWGAGWDSGVPHKNSWPNLCSTAIEAKAQASQYVREHIPNTSNGAPKMM